MVKSELQLSMVKTQETQTLVSCKVPYVEVPGISSVDMDILGQFKSNLAQLDQLQAKLGFMLNEVSGLLKKK